MISKETAPDKGIIKHQADRVLSQGNWDENISWSFIAAQEVPNDNDCTAACCVTIYQGKLVLVENRRGWELPAGKRIPGETLTQTAIREVREESGAIIEQPHFFGYKKLTAQTPVLGKDGTQYPFPHSYVAFFYAQATGFQPLPLESDVKQRQLVTWAEAQELLRDGAQYTGVLEFLRDHGLIEVN